MFRGVERTGAQTADIGIRRLAGRQALPLAVVAVALWVFRDHLSVRDWQV